MNILLNDSSTTWYYIMHIYFRIQLLSWMTLDLFIQR